jgi:hypothetical protein
LVVHDARRTFDVLAAGDMAQPLSIKGTVVDDAASGV